MDYTKSQSIGSFLGFQITGRDILQVLFVGDALEYSDISVVFLFLIVFSLCAIAISFFIRWAELETRQKLWFDITVRYRILISLDHHISKHAIGQAFIIRIRYPQYKLQLFCEVPNVVDDVVSGGLADILRSLLLHRVRFSQCSILSTLDALLTTTTSTWYR